MYLWNFWVPIGLFNKLTCFGLIKSGFDLETFLADSTTFGGFLDDSPFVFCCRSSLKNSDASKSLNDAVNVKLKFFSNYNVSFSQSVWKYKPLNALSSVFFFFSSGPSLDESTFLLSILVICFYLLSSFVWVFFGVVILRLLCVLKTADESP